jgi:modulator of FtsH protease
MSLYDRNYTQSSSTADYGYGARDEVALRSFIKQTYQLFAASLLAGTVGSYVGMGMVNVVSSFYWLFVIAEIALIFGLNFAKNNPALSLVMLFSFTFLTGLTLAPLLTSILNMSGGAGIVTNAFLMTTVAFGGLSLFAMKTDRDFSTMGKMLFIALIVVIVGSIANIFIGSSMLQLGIAMVSSILFSFFILYDTQNIVKGNYDSPVLAASALYLDFFNLFVSLLQILGLTNKDE